MGRISEALYSGISDSTKKAYAFVASMSVELSQWRDSLPSKLRVVTGPQSEKTCYLPAVLELHLQYHGAVILLHRPFISQIASQDSSPSAQKMPLSARESCTQSATQICQLLNMYRQAYGLKRIYIQITHVAMTASLIHIYNCCNLSGAQGKRAQELLLICIQALAEMGQTYRTSSRALEVVTSLRRDWQTETFTSMGKKRPR